MSRSGELGLPFSADNGTLAKKLEQHGSIYMAFKTHSYCVELGVTVLTTLEDCALHREAWHCICRCCKTEGCVVQCR